MKTIGVFEFINERYIFERLRNVLDETWCYPYYQKLADKLSNSKIDGWDFLMAYAGMVNDIDADLGRESAERVLGLSAAYFASLIKPRDVFLYRRILSLDVYDWFSYTSNRENGVLVQGTDVPETQPLQEGVTVGDVSAEDNSPNTETKGDKVENLPTRTALMRMKRGELVEFAKTLGIDGHGKNKAKIVEEIEKLR